MILKSLNVVKIVLVLLSAALGLLALFNKIKLEVLFGFTYFMLFAIVGGTIFAALFAVFQKPSSGLKFGIGFITLIISYFIFYSISSDSVLNGEIVSGSRSAEALIRVFWFSITIALGLTLFSIVKKAFK